MIDIKLITFLIVAETRNFTRAAKILNMTQPAVSHHIKLLEEYYQVTLFHKKNKQMELTEEGRILLKYGREVVRLNNTVKSILDNKSSIIKKYNLGATLTIGGYVLPELIAAYKKENRNIDIILQVGNTETILKKLYNGEIDLGVIEGPFDKTKVNYKKFKDDELVLVVSKDNWFSKREAVSIEEVLESKLILREKGSGTRKIFENYLNKAGYELKDANICMEIGDITAIISLVESNLGCTIISREAVKNSLQNKAIKVIPIKNFTMLREFNFTFLNDADKDFIDDFINFCCLHSGYDKKALYPHKKS